MGPILEASKMASKTHSAKAGEAGKGLGKPGKNVAKVAGHPMIVIAITGNPRPPGKRKGK